MTSARTVSLLAGLSSLMLTACGADPSSSDVASTTSEGGQTEGAESNSSNDDDTGTTEGSAGGSDDSGSGPGGGEPETRDGSRLAIEWLVPESGPARVVGIFDTELGVACSFRTASDGVLRCLPTTDANRGEIDAATGDTKPYLEVNEECMPTFLVDDDGTSRLSCDTPGWRVFEPGELRSEICVSSSGGQCLATQSPGPEAPPGAGYLFLGDPVAPATFVAGEPTLDSGDTRLRRRFVEADDGARIAWDIYDTQTERPCSFVEADDGQLRCLPLLPLEGSAYVESSDAWIPYASGNTGCEPNQIDALDSPGRYTCDVATHTLYMVGEVLDEVCIQTTNGVCSSWRSFGDEAPEGAAFFLADAALDLSGFVAGEVGAPEGDGRIQTMLLVAEDGPTQEAGLFDSELGQPCAFSVAADGKLRCLPQTFSAGLHYIPREEEWGVYLGGNAGCAPAFINAPIPSTSFSCEPARSEIHTARDTAEQVCLSTAVPGSCSSWLSLSDEAPSGAGLYVAGDLVDPAGFVGGA